MSFRESFSKLKKDVKRRLKGKRHKSDRSGTDTGGESVDSTRSPSRSGLQVVGGSGRDQGGSNTVGGRAHSTDGPRQPDQPETMPVVESEQARGERETGVDGRKVNPIHPNLDPDVEAVAGSGHGGEVEPAYPSLSATSIPRGVKPDGM
jgi:hypothetical protein